MSKFKVYRKRPDIKQVTLTLHGCDLTYSLIRPTTVQHIALTHTMMAMYAAVQQKAAHKATENVVEPRTYAECAASVLEFVSNVEGLADEDGSDLAYADMDNEDRESFVFNLPVDHIGALISALVEIHMFGDVKKKPSTPTSETSTSTDPADVQAVEEA